MRIRYLLASALLGLLSAFAISCAQEKAEKPPQIQLKLNASNHLSKPTVVMISIDGYRHDYTKKYLPPNLTALSENGVQAQSLKPSYPSLTFPNHYTLATGLLPEHHGLVGNFFFDKKRNEAYAFMDGKNVRDGSWYGGTPLWRAVSRNGMLSATLYWVGSEAEIAGGKADYVQPWNPPLDHTERVNKVIDWLKLPEANRPHFISLYFSAVDHAGHLNSPDSTQVRNAVLDVDAAIGKLRDYAKTANPPINIVVVSDHGMKSLDANKFINLFELVDLSAFQVQERGAVSQLYSNDETLIQSTLKEINKIDHIKAYRRADTPAKLHYRNNDRIGDIVVIAEVGYYVRSKAKEFQDVVISAKSGGTHGWDNDEPEMHGIFYAEGPNFKQHTVIPTFHNIHIYPMILDLLGLPILPSDGDVNVLHGILVK